MAVIVEYGLPGCTTEQVYAAEQLAQARGEAVGGPPYRGLMFLR